MPFGFFDEEDESFSGLSGHVTKRRDLSLERISAGDVPYVSKSGGPGSFDPYASGSASDNSFNQTKQRGN